jgi:hypothetical protein
VALVAIAGAVAVALDRRKTLLRLAIGVAIATIVVLGAIASGRTFFVTHAASRASPDVTGKVYDTLSQFLHDSLRLTLLVSVVVAALLWLIGPARWARSLRGLAGKGLHWLAQLFSALVSTTRRAESSERVVRAAHFPLEHASGLRLLGVGVVGCILVFGGNLSAWGILWSALGLVVYLIVLQGVLAWAHRLTSVAGTAP